MTRDHLDHLRFSPVQVLMILICALLFGFVPGALGAEPDHVPGEILVQFRENASLLGVQQALANRPGQQHLTDRVSRVLIRPGETVEQVIIELESLPEVEFAEPNYIRRIQRVPNDPFFEEQWALRNTGQTPQVDGAAAGMRGMDIGAVAAWDVTTGNRSVVVAVIDTGVDLDHPDLEANFWRDAAGNIGRDFVSPGTPPEDVEGHGTAMAGIIGARGNNGLGITGVAWEVSLMPLRVFESDGTGNVATIVEAIDYAVANGARIINASYGLARTSSELERSAIEEAGQRGVLFVAAACNNGENNDPQPEDSQQSPCYPASYDLPNIISVAATDNSDALIVESNYGVESVHLGAPGQNILSLRRGSDAASLDTLIYNTGTSASAAMVSGAAALLLSHEPFLSPVRIRDLLMENADSAPNLQDRTISGGRLNVARALSAPPVRVDGGSGRLDLPALAALLACLGLLRLRQWKCRR